MGGGYEGDRKGNGRKVRKGTNGKGREHGDRNGNGRRDRKRSVAGVILEKERKGKGTGNGN